MSYLDSNSLGDNSKWVWSGDKKILPIGWTVTYEITYYSDCPQNPATLYVAATGYFSVYLNGVLIGSGGPWPKTHKFDLLKLLCGCNKIKIVVKNHFPSPAAIIYSISQNKAGCYDCKNLGVTFYNRDTCKCECVSRCPTCGEGNSPLSWFDYPTCGCMCKQSLLCSKPKFFNMQTCRCECNKVCCPKGQYRNPSTC